MGGVEVSRAALEVHRGGIAVLDSSGNVTWTDEAWATDGDESGLPRAAIGSNLLQVYRGYADPRAQAIADAIVAVFAGKVTYFEVEHRPERGSQSSFVTSVAALRGERAGAVLIHKVVGEPAPSHPGRPADGRGTDGVPTGPGAARLTPREREVLDLMAVGLDNRAIAAKLGIQYTTVRGHVRSVVEKLGARSRLEAVARAYRMGLAPT
jgi:DNA-binding NarL/FixJ family response regulator